MTTQPDPARSSVERFLDDFHRRHPSATSSFLGEAPAGDHGSSYDLLLELVPAGPAPIVALDLACGDGFLLERLAARRQPGLRLIGVDLCAADLRIAGERLGDGGATLLCERAQAMSVPDASVDVVLCHMALMLMDDVEAVIASVRRVLRPGGVFSAVVGGGGLPVGGAFEVFVALIRGALAEEATARLPIGDPRTRSREGLEALLGEGAGFEAPLEAREVVVRLDAPPAALWRALALTYDVDLLSAEGRARTEAAFLEATAPRAREDGSVACSLGLRQVTCRKTKMPRPEEPTTMSSNDLTRLQADLEAAEAEVSRVREENARLAEAFRAEPTDDAREVLKRAAASLAAARDRAEAARVALEVLKRTGSPHGLLAENGKVVGSTAVAIPGGASSAERARRIEEALGEALIEAARELGVVLGAAPEKYTREKPGRDEQGRTVLEVIGRVEGDVLVPAVSRSARLMRS